MRSADAHVSTRDWYDGWIEEGEMKVYLIADTHFNHAKIKTYCQRPDNFTELLIKNWKQTVQPTDLVLHLGDVFIGPSAGWKEIYPQLPGRKGLIRGNHDRNHSNTWWMENGFDFACDSMIFRHVWLTHEPAKELPAGTDINIHGHLHNIWHGFHRNSEPGTPEYDSFVNKRLYHPWQRLFAVEYTNYRPVDFEKFLSKPDNFHARGLRVPENS
jgi:calcineurin-like phosphoesterase family protein